MCKSNQNKDNVADVRCNGVVTNAEENSEGSLSDDELSQVNGGAPLTFGREKLKAT